MFKNILSFNNIMIYLLEYEPRSPRPMKLKDSQKSQLLILEQNYKEKNLMVKINNILSKFNTSLTNNNFTLFVNLLKNHFINNNLVMNIIKIIIDNEILFSKLTDLTT